MTNMTQPSLSQRLDRRRAATRVPSSATEETPETTELARGKSPATPFLLIGSVAFFVFCAVAVVTLAALLVWWLV
jgi:hypothetical protein